MAKYRTENGVFDVDLTKYYEQEATFGDDCEGMIAIYSDTVLEDIFTEEKDLKEDYYSFLNVYYTITDNCIVFESLKLEINFKEADVLCNEKEIKMFNELLNSIGKEKILGYIEKEQEKPSLETQLSDAKKPSSEQSRQHLTQHETVKSDFGRE